MLKNKHTNGTSIPLNVLVLMGLIARPTRINSKPRYRSNNINHYWITKMQ